MGRRPGAVVASPSNTAGVAFATLKPKLHDASTQWVDSMRGTLRHAREINNALAEAEVAVSKARAVGAAIDAATGDAELRSAASEIDRITTFLTTGVRPTEKSSSPLQPSPVALAFVQAADSPSSTPVGSLASGYGPSGASVGAFAMSAGSMPGTGLGDPASAAQMEQEIDTTAIWVQQIMDTVQLMEANFKHDKGASLAPVLQEKMRQHDRTALRTALALDGQRKDDAVEAPVGGPLLAVDSEAAEQSEPGPEAASAAAAVEEVAPTA